MHTPGSVSLVHRICRSILIPALILTTTTFGPAHAAVIGTGDALQAQQTEAAMGSVQAFFTRADARAALIRMGVDPADALARVESLTPEEAQLLAAKIDQLPAGEIGVIEVVGIVAVVLIVLELLGVTNVFTRL